eukprot:gene7930-9756_t
MDNNNKNNNNNDNNKNSNNNQDTFKDDDNIFRKSPPFPILPFLDSPITKMEPPNFSLISSPPLPSTSTSTTTTTKNNKGGPTTTPPPLILVDKLSSPPNNNQSSSSSSLKSPLVGGVLQNDSQKSTTPIPINNKQSKHSLIGGLLQSSSPSNEISIQHHHLSTNSSSSPSNNNNNNNGGGSSPNISSSTYKSPNLFSPQTMISLSPSLFSSPLRDRIVDGYMDEYYEIDKDQKALEKQKDELAAWNNVIIPKSYLLARKELKFIIRRGIPDDKKNLVWKVILGFDEFTDEVGSYRDAHSHFYGNSIVPKKIRNIPTFGGVVSPSDHYLTDEGIQAVKRILAVIALNFPDIEYCPVLPDIEPDTYTLIVLLIKHSSSSFYRYLNTSNRECTLFVLTFDSLVEKNNPKIWKHITNLGMSGTKPFAEEWFSRLFISFIPFQTALRIFDIYLNEGYKVLYRVGLAMLQLHKNTLLKTTTMEQFLSTLKQLNSQLHDSDLLMKKAFGIHMKRDQLNNFDTKHHDKLSDVPEPNIPIYYKPKVSTPSTILKEDDYEYIWAWLPHKLCICDPKIVFSSVQNGFNLRLLYEKCRDKSPLLVVIKSNSGAVFGFFTGDELKPNDRFGLEETFVWSLSPQIHVYKPTGKNENFIVMKHNYIAVGCSERGEHAVYLDSELNGKTEFTETFDNPQLNPASPEFESVFVEVISFE